jgi:hypothetical protein
MIIFFFYSEYEFLVGSTAFFIRGALWARNKKQKLIDGSKLP